MDNSQFKPLPFVKLSLTLTAEALGFLAGTTNGVSHFALYHALLVNMCTDYQTITKRGISIKMRPNQSDASVNALSEKFGLGRKVITRLLTTMCQLGIINLTFSKLITVADILDVFAMDEKFLADETYTKILRKLDADVSASVEIAHSLEALFDDSQVSEDGSASTDMPTTLPVLVSSHNPDEAL